MTRDEIINSQEYKKEKSYIDAWQEGYQDAIDNACAWLKMKAGFTIGIDGATRQDFRDFMEGRSNKQYRKNNERQLLAKDIP